MVGGTYWGKGKGLIVMVGENWEVVEGMIRVGEFWTNEGVRFRYGKKILEDKN